MPAFTHSGYWHPDTMMHGWPNHVARPDAGPLGSAWRHVVVRKSLGILALALTVIQVAAGHRPVIMQPVASHCGGQTHTMTAGMQGMVMPEPAAAIGSEFLNSSPPLSDDCCGNAAAGLCGACSIFAASETVSGSLPAESGLAAASPVPALHSAAHTADTPPPRS
jgi:hypothetical protein